MALTGILIVGSTALEVTLMIAFLVPPAVGLKTTPRKQSELAGSVPPVQLLGLTVKSAGLAPVTLTAVT